MCSACMARSLTLRVTAGNQRLVWSSALGRAGQRCKCRIVTASEQCTGLLKEAQHQLQMTEFRKICILWPLTELKQRAVLLKEA